VIWTEEQARQRIGALPQGVEPRIKWAGFDLPGEVAAGNLLVAGAIGSGKTRIQRQLLQSFLKQFRPESGRKVLIFDTKGDLSEEIARMSPSSPPLVFSGSDNLSSAWDLAADIMSGAEARHFAEALIESTPDNATPFFTDAAREVLAKLVLALNRQQPGNFNLGTIIRITSSPEDLKRALSGGSAEQYLLSSPTSENVQSTLLSFLIPLQATANLWERAGRKVSLKQWVSNGESPLILAGDARFYERVAAINRILLNQITSFILAEPESATSSRFWFFFDDLNSVGRLDSLPSLLNARAKGVRCALSFTDLDGLSRIYGGQTAVDVIFDRCSTVAFLRLASSSTASWASQRTGNDFQPDDFIALPQCGVENITAIHMIKGLRGNFKATTKL
jgi:type IV secretory pathway TraG/TraD family ATPase VirD4